jgi:hypothetical protein
MKFCCSLHLTYRFFVDVYDILTFCLYGDIYIRKSGSHVLQVDNYRQANKEITNVPLDIGRVVEL